MAGAPFGEVVRGFQRLYGEGTLIGLSESQLLDRFLARRDEKAFEALVTRHGPMVLAVCRRILRDEHAADDAFQATFLVFVRKAATIRGSDLLGPWLHRVAYRVAIRAGQAEAKRLAKEAPAPDILASAPAPDRACLETRIAVHEALDSLPEKYRAPIVLCDLEGCTHDEAARTLRWPIGSVKGRLSRGRAILKTRLERKGTLVPAGLLAATFGQDALASVSIPLKVATVRAAIAFAAGNSGALAVGTFSASAALLAEQAARTMMIKKCAVGIASVAGMFLVVGSAAVIARQDGGKPGVEGAKVIASSETPKSEKASPSENTQSDQERLQGVWIRRAHFVKGYAQPPGAAPTTLERIIVEGNTLSGTLNDRSLAEPRSFKVEDSKTPKQFEWRRAGPTGEEITRGIYKIEDGNFTISYDFLDSNVPPTAFDSVVGTDTNGSAKAPSKTITSSYVRETSPPKPNAESQAELDRLQGSWAQTKFEMDGEVQQPFSGGNVPTPRTMTFKGNSRITLGGRSGELVEEVALDLKPTPHVMELRQLERPNEGWRTSLSRISYQLNQDELILCWSSLPNGEIPTTAPEELRTRVGDGRVLVVYKRYIPKSKSAAGMVSTAPIATSAASISTTPPTSETTGRDLALRLQSEVKQHQQTQDSILDDADRAEDEIVLLRDQIRAYQKDIVSSKRTDLLETGGNREVHERLNDQINRMEHIIAGLRKQLREVTSNARKARREARVIQKSSDGGRRTL